MRFLATVHEGVLNGLAVVSGALIAIVTLAVIGDVVVRNIGFQPPPHTSAFAEYSLLYVTLLGSPWLLRRKGHVYIEVVLSLISARARRACAILTYVACLASCLLLLYYAVDLTVLNWKNGDYDIRSFDMPRWLLFAPMPISFLLMAIEFSRYLLGYDSMYSSGPPVH